MEAGYSDPQQKEGHCRQPWADSPALSSANSGDGSKEARKCLQAARGSGHEPHRWSQVSRAVCSGCQAQECVTVEGGGIGLQTCWDQMWVGGHPGLIWSAVQRNLMSLC